MNASKSIPSAARTRKPKTQPDTKEKRNNTNTDYNNPYIWINPVLIQ
jgi:hypothetical protein